MSEVAAPAETPVEKAPTHTVIDNTDVAAVIANARGEKPPEKPKAEVKAEPVAKVEAKPDPDDLGLTDDELKNDALTATVRKAVDRKHRKYKEAEEFAQSQFAEKQAALKDNEKLRRDLARLQEQITPAPKAEEAKEPDRADFKGDKEYADAMIDYRVDQRLKAKETADHNKALADRQREMIATANERITKAREMVPDFDEVVGAIDAAVPQAIAGYMQESEMFAELGYHLAKNPQVLERLEKLNPARQLVEIGKIEGTLKPFVEKSAKVEGKQETATPVKDGKAETPPSTNGNPPSKARPEPIKPIDTGSVSQVEKDPSEMTYEETLSSFQKRNKVNLRARQRH